jgi:catechol 2,3-dioxygenase-like lactoylglutathione lyase family enzyme
MHQMSPILQNHYALAARDARRSADFYVRMLGFHVGRPMIRTAGNPR